LLRFGYAFKGVLIYGSIESTRCAHRVESGASCNDVRFHAVVLSSAMRCMIGRAPNQGAAVRMNVAREITEQLVKIACNTAPAANHLFVELLANYLFLRRTNYA
jgi:hypothetical protein